MPRVVVTEPVHDDALAMLRQAGWDVMQTDGEMPPADALLVRTRQVPSKYMNNFKIISKHGAGVDNIAVEAAQRSGTVVTNTPGANAAAVAEQTLMLMLALTRNFHGQLDALGRGARSPQVVGLEGLRLLIVGTGKTGRRVGQLASGFHMVPVWLSRGRPAGELDGFPVTDDLASALPNADILTMHCPLTPDTRSMIGKQELALLPEGAFVVNVARGGLVDEVALVAALESGHLGGAALDVTETEPLPMDHALRKAPRLLLTPHAAGMGRGSFRRMGMEAAQNILDHAAGRLRRECVVIGGEGQCG